MPRRKKLTDEEKLEQAAPQPITFDQRIKSMRTGRIEKEYLSDLVMAYKFKKNIDSTYPMPRELAEVVLIIIDKMLGSASWRNYTDDWKEEFRGRAIEHVLKYAHNFDPEKSKSGKNDPYNYFAMIISNAFIQSWKKCKAYADSNVLLNDEILYNVESWDELYETPPTMGTINPNPDAIDWGHF
jgi:hypothetical protein